MKKLLFSLAFIGAMLTSCVNNAEIDYSGKEAVDVVLGINVPELAMSRAGETDMNSGLGAIDNFSADEWEKYDLRYIFEVYDVTPGYEDLNNPIKQRLVKTYDEYQSTQFELRLIPNRTYKFVVWADFVDEDTDTDLNYNTTTLSNITRMGNASPMDESMDAYFIQKDIAISNELSESLTLTRPFGKIRVIATDIDEVNIGSTPAKVEATFYNHPIFTSLNALTGMTETTTETVTYSYSIAKDAPYTEGYDSETSYQTLFADYIFAQSAEENGAQEVNFKMAVKSADDRLIREQDFNTQIPLERNKLTTLIGNLLTTTTEFNITIDDNFDGSYDVNPDAIQLEAPVATASVAGNVVTLTWSEVAHADYYNVVCGNTVETTTATTMEFTLDYETEYTFTVQACTNNTMDFKASELSSATATTEVLVVKLDTPEATTSVAGNVVTLSWTAVDNADYYTVVCGDLTETTTATTMEFTLEYETEYIFTVQADSNDTIHFTPSDVATAKATTETAPVTVVEYIYLKPNSNWLTDNARFKVYTWIDGGASNWYDMVDSDGDGIYEVEKSKLNSKVIFCRINPSSTTNNWNNVWNQTNDLTLPTNGNNMYTIVAGAWSNGNGTWSKK